MNIKFAESVCRRVQRDDRTTNITARPTHISRNSFPLTIVQASTHGFSDAILYLSQLLEAYGEDATVTEMFDKLDWYIIPVLNVDGYIYTWTNVSQPHSTDYNIALQSSYICIWLFKLWWQCLEGVFVNNEIKNQFLFQCSDFKMTSFSILFASSEKAFRV